MEVNKVIETDFLRVWSTLKGYAEDPVKIYGSMIAYQGIMNDPLLLSVYVLVASTLLCYVLGFATRNYSWVDRWWSIVPVVYSGIFAFAGASATTKLVALDLRTLIVFVLILLWGLRLTYNFHRKGGYSLSTEDYRWAYVKSWFPSVVLWELFHFLFICAYQNILLWLITLPVYVCSKYRTELTVTDYILAVLQFALLLGETLADQQQWSFHLKKAQQKKKTDAAVKQGFLTEGLWKYSRHPNFFCEISQWFVVYAFSVSATKESLNYTIIGAVLLLLLFQGSTWLTEKISSEKYPLYKNYKQTTSRLIPWFPSKPQSTQKKNK